METSLQNLPSKEIMPGFHGKMVHSRHMTLAFWEVQEGSRVPEHSHANEQIMHVLEGDFEFTVGGVTGVYHPGDIVVVNAHILHSGVALTPCRLLDVFSPAREEYK